MHYRQIMALLTRNDVLLCKVFPSSLAGPTLLWFHRLAPNSIKSFHQVFEKFVSQYMCSMRRKQSVTSLFHMQMGRSETIRDGPPCFNWFLLALTLRCRLLSKPFTRTHNSLTLSPYSLPLRLMNYSREVTSTLCSRTML